MLKVPKFIPPAVPTERQARREHFDASRPTRESQIERRLVERVKQLGGEVRKVKWIGRTGAPDRLVMLPDGRIFAVDQLSHGRTIWVEVKAPGKKAEAHQHREHERMRKMGQRVEVVDSYERIEEILK